MTTLGRGPAGPGHQRFFGSARVLPLVFASLLTASCGSSPSSHSASGNGLRSTASSAPTSATGGTTPGGGTPDASPGSTTTSARSTTTTGTPASGTTETPPPGPGPAAPGRYSYRQTGSETVGGQSQAVPPEGVDILDPAGNQGDGAWTQTTHEYIDPSQPPTDSSYQISSKGWALQTEVFRYAYNGSTVTFNCQFAPPLPVISWPPSVGTSFSGTGNCGSFTVSVSGKVTGHQQSQVGTTNVTSWVIDATFTTKGQLTSTTTLTAWFAPQLGVDVHEAQQSQGSYSFFQFSVHTTRDLASTTPS